MEYSGERRRRVEMDQISKLTEFERLAEASYAAMYDAEPHNVKDYRDDAQLYLAHAIDAAKAASLADEVARLERRSAEMAAAYNSQFRGVGR